MKRSINLFLVLLLVSTGLFAGVPAVSSNTTGRIYSQKTDIITFSTLPSRKGIEVKFKKGIAGKAIVVIYDSDKNMLRKDILSNEKLAKGYILTTLDNGDYTVEVTLNKLIMKKDIHVYMEGQIKTFIIKS
jgi:hypothetical protein